MQQTEKYITQPKTASKAKTAEVVVEMKNVKKSFGDKDILKNVSLCLKKEENLVILGRSGVGKSVAIKCIVGMLTQDEGTVTVFGDEVSEKNDTELKELRTKIGFLFQNGALYDSLSVRENLEFPLTRVLKIHDQAELDKNVEEVLDAVGLNDAIDKMPAELSGGMRKRVGLARTLIVRPQIMLYDEPTTGLDPITSREISELILQMRKKYKISSIIITHDMTCARITADRLLVLSEGEFIAEGSYRELERSDKEIIRSFFK